MLDAIAAVCFCLAFFAGGYCLGRLAQPPRVGFEVDPDPLRVDEGAEVVSLDAVRRGAVRARAS